MNKIHSYVNRSVSRETLSRKTKIMKINNCLQLVNSQKSTKIDTTKTKNKLKFLYMKHIQEVEKLLEKVEYTSYLDVFVKSIEHTKYVQTKDKYIIEFENFHFMFDSRSKIINEICLKFKMNFDQMIIVSENQLTIFK